MKIAIKGHASRGKEVIQILESLGGVKICPLKGDAVLSYYYINYDCNNAIHCHDHNYVNKYCKKYTLEEFEKEFPFKIGDKVQNIYSKNIGTIVKICYNPATTIAYKVQYNLDREYLYSASQLELYKEMEERNITLTLDKAKEWYKKGGELKEIALQAFTEKELNPLPRSWEEYCREHKSICLSTRYANISLKYDALIKLEQLRNCWWNGWEPEWNNCEKYVIKWDNYDLIVFTARNIRAFLVFPTREMAYEFLNCFRDLIETARDLI